MKDHYTHHFNTDVATADHKLPIVNSMNCLLYIQRGNGYLTMKDGTFPLLQGQCCLIPAGYAASYQAESGTTWDYIWLLFDGALFDEILRKIAFSPANPICTVTEAQADLIQRISTRKYTARSGEYYHTLGLLVHLFSSFTSTFPSETLIAEDGSLRSVIAFIHSNLHRSDLSVEYLARITGVSRITLCNRFKKELGCSPKEYIQKRRIFVACNLLSTTQISVTQIAAAVGYDNPLYFSRIFHKAMNRPPAEYRKHFLRREKV